jgi:hypothetical protein
MKLYKRSDFIKLPEGTVYSRLYENTGHLMEGLFCKVSGSDYGNDWVEQDLIAECGFPNGITDGTDAIDYVESLRDTLQDFETDLHCAGRDGMFEDSDLFVVWDKKDVKKLADYLNDLLK